MRLFEHLKYGHSNLTGPKVFDILKKNQPSLNLLLTGVLWQEGLCLKDDFSWSLYFAVF